MKKFFAFFIACLLVMQFTFIPASAEGAEYEPYLKGVQETGSYVGDIEELRQLLPKQLQMQPEAQL